MSRILLLLPILLLSTGVFSSGGAIASCGDWLAHSASSDSTAVAELVTEPAEVPCPCRGPGCGQSPADSVPTPAAPGTERQSDVACWLPVGSQVSFLSAGFIGSSHLRLPSGASAGIDRPPQS